MGVLEDSSVIKSNVPGLMKPEEDKGIEELISRGGTPKWMATTFKLSPDCDVYSMVEPGILPIGVTVVVDVGIMAVGGDSVGDSGKGEVIRERVGVWVYIDSTRAVSLFREVGVKYGS